MFRTASLPFFALLLFSASVFVGTCPAFAQFSVLITEKADPYGWPRPGSGETSVPLKTSYYIVLKGPNSSDLIDTASVTVQIRRGTSLVKEVVTSGTFASDCSGYIQRYNPETAVYVTTDLTLLPATRYKTRVYAASLSGARLNDDSGYAEWSWTTEIAPTTHTATWNFNFLGPIMAPRADWVGEHFVGLMCPGLCTTAKFRKPGFDFLRQYRLNGYPNQWDLVIKNAPLDLAYRPETGLVPFKNEPNTVRELETRHIYDIQTSGTNRVLYVEDFFGHEQYRTSGNPGSVIPDNRSIALDYAPGNIVSIADGVNFTTATVVRLLDTSGTTQALEVSGFAALPGGGWLNYTRSQLPTKENPDAPGLFPPGGVYLRKHSPAPLPSSLRYYWGRVDKEYDYHVYTYDQRVLLRIRDAPGDVDFDGQLTGKAKDNVEVWQVLHDFATHLLDRYGTATCATFYWSIFAEPDLVAQWRDDWQELQRFYDYASDGILRAFEEKGADPNIVKIGGTELAGINGTNLKLDAFLAHCSPGDDGVKDELVGNACYADPRLNGKRSQWLESYCGANGGTGAALNFLSIHCYNKASLAADKLKAAMDKALAIDPGKYTSLSVCSLEASPGWQMQHDTGAQDSFFGNGYLSSWCADVTRRRLLQAQQDSRYRYGETILTVWPWIEKASVGISDEVRSVAVDDNGDGIKDRDVIVNNQVCNFLNLLSTTRDTKKCFPEMNFGGYVLGGFFGIMEGSSDRYAVITAHNWQDIQSRSDRAFTVNISFNDSHWTTVSVTQYRFDKFHNSYNDMAQELREDADKLYTPAQLAAVQARAALQVTRHELMALNSEGDITVPISIAANGVNFVLFSDGSISPKPTPIPAPAMEATDWKAYR